MPNKSKYSRGSEWRKWDLHVHSPASDGFSGTWEQFEAQLKNADCAVIGINDYCSVAGYRKIKDKINNKTLDLGNKKVFPIVEFRMTETVQNKNTSTSGVTHFNFHIVFDDLISVDDIENFIKGLKCEGTKISSDYANSAKLKLKKVSFEAVLNELSQDNKFKDRYLIWLPYDEYGGIDEIDPNSDGWIKGNFVRKAHILGSSRQKQIDFFLWKSDVKEDGAPKFTQDQFKEWFVCKKACLKGSDSHSYEYPIGKLKDKNSKPMEKYCWIKADPTFEGLKQIVYEPSERICLCEQNPGFIFDKPYFGSLKIENKLPIFESDQDQVYFEKEEILLNKNLVAIIGGRGSGKSLLLNYLAAAFHRKAEDTDPNLLISDKFKIVYAKNNKENPDTAEYLASNENYLDFLFIPQGKLKSIVKAGSLNAEIKSLLELETLSFSEQTAKDITSILQNIKTIHAWFNEVDEFGEKTNEKKLVKIKKDRNEKLLESITTRENEEKLKVYSQNVDTMQTLEEDKGALIELRRVVAQGIIELNEQINILNKYKIPDISGAKQDAAMDSAIKEIKLKIEAAEDENKKIREGFKGVFTGDLSKLLKNVETYRRAIKVAELKLTQIEKQEIKFKGALEERSKLGLSIGKELRRQSDLITEKWDKIFDQFEDEKQKKVIKKILSDRKIVVKGEIVFNKEKFYELLQERINLLYFKSAQGKTREQRIVEWVGISDINSFEEYIGKKLAKQYDDEEEQKRWLNGIDPSELFFSLSIRSQYLYTQASVTYQGKPISKLSAGQRGTTFLCIQLARNAFSSPIVFDQPEDDLDNEFIIEELVGIFKTLKRYRQIIIVTHNANLVVNADAEQVVVASNKEELLSYSSGSLENQEIIEAVCTILEGGKDAFEKRKSKYTSILL